MVKPQGIDLLSLHRCWLCIDRWLFGHFGSVNPRTGLAVKVGDPCTVCRLLHEGENWTGIEQHFQHPMTSESPFTIAELSESLGHQIILLATLSCSSCVT